MTIEEILEDGTTAGLGVSARGLVVAAAKFIEELAKNNIELDFGEADNTTNEIDYNAPVSDSYKKTYKPITTTEIIQANKSMSEAISGEKWIAGFMTMVKLLLMAK